MICNGCLKEIDPAFDAVSRDAVDRPWHTPCWVDACGGAQDVGVNPNAGLASASFSPTLYVGAKLLDRWQLRRQRRALRNY